MHYDKITYIKRNRGKCKMKDIFNIENFNIIEDEENFDTSKAKLKKGIVYRAPTARISSYKALNNKQSLEKNKIIAKLTILERVGGMTPIIPHTANNNLLVQTIGRAFSSLELIHYGEIEKEEIIEIPKEIVDMFALLQQQE